MIVREQNSNFIHLLAFPAVWDSGNNTGACPQFAFNTESALKQFHALTHAGQAKVLPFAADFCHPVRIETTAVVLHDKLYILIVSCEHHLDMLCPGVFASICQRLLRDTINAHFQACRMLRESEIRRAGELYSEFSAFTSLLRSSIVARRAAATVCSAERRARCIASPIWSPIMCSSCSSSGSSSRQSSLATFNTPNGVALA